MGVFHNYQTIYLRTKTMRLLTTQTKIEIEKMLLDSREHILNSEDEFEKN